MHLESNINYPHSRITATENKLYKNYLIESTITQSHERSGPIDHKYAENIVRNVNISNSNSSFVNAVYVISGNTDLDAIVSFSTFVKNIANSLRCLLNYENGIRINRCSIISNECSLTTKDFNGVISASPNVKLSVTDCIILNNKGYALFCARKDGSITVSSCFIPSNTYKSYTQSVRGNANFDISTTGSFNIKNSHFSTALCYADFLFCSLTQITTDKTKYKIRQDTTITGTVSFDQNKEESFTLEIWIDNYPSTKLSRSSGSSTYQYSINIPSGLSIGNHKIYSKFSDENTLRSNIVSAEFQYLNAFSLNLNDLEKTDYNKTIDKYIKVQGSGVYSEEFSIKCSIGGILSTFNGIPNKNPETYTFDFSGTCLIPDSIAEEKKYLVTVWATTNLGESTEPTSKQFQLNRNFPVLEVTPLAKRRFIHNDDRVISVYGYVSDYDCDDIVTVKGIIEGYPSTQKSQSISVTDSQKHQFSLNIVIPDGLSRDYHPILIDCCDKSMKCVSSNQEIFYYDFNAPSIKITQKPAFPININQYHNLEFYLLVSDKDGNSQIRIFHDLNSTQGNLVNISLYDSPQEIPYFIPISKDINVGNCPLKFFAIDDYNIYSKFVTINVSFEEFSPEYANKKRWKKIKKRSPFQLLFYAFSVGKS